MRALSSPKRRVPHGAVWKNSSVDDCDSNSRMLTNTPNYVIQSYRVVVVVAAVVVVIVVMLVVLIVRRA